MKFHEESKFHKMNFKERRGKMMNNLFKKGVSATLTVAMMATMIVPGGLMAGAYSADLVDLVNGTPPTVSANGTNLTKSAAWMGGDSSNKKIDVTLGVGGVDTTSSQATTDIVLLLDTSSSMSSGSIASMKSNADAFLQKVMLNADKSEKTNVNVAIVNFNSNSTVFNNRVSSTTSTSGKEKNPDGKGNKTITRYTTTVGGYESYSAGNVSSYFTNHYSTVENIPSTTSDWSGSWDSGRYDRTTTNHGLDSLNQPTDGIVYTFTQSALYTAGQLLKTDTDPTHRKIVVLMSDGAPNYSYAIGSTAPVASAHTWEQPSPDQSSTHDDNYIINSFNYSSIIKGSSYTGVPSNLKAGNYKVYNFGIPTISEAESLKQDQKATVFTIGYNLSTAGQATSDQAAFVLKNCASSLDKYIPVAGSDAALKTAFEKIATVTNYPNVTVTDKVGSEYSFVSFLNSDGTQEITADEAESLYGASYEGNTVSWGLSSYDGTSNHIKYRIELLGDSATTGDHVTTGTDVTTLSSTPAGGSALTGTIANSAEPLVRIGYGTFTYQGYLVDDHGTALLDNGAEITFATDSPTQANVPVGTQQTADFANHDAANGYMLYTTGMPSGNFTLTIDSPSHRFDIPYTKAISIPVEYRFTDGSHTYTVSGTALSTTAGSSYASQVSGIPDATQSLVSSQGIILDNFARGSSIDHFNGIAPLTQAEADANPIIVPYTLQQGNVTVNFYKDSVTNTSDSAHFLGSEGLFSSQVDVTTPITSAEIQAKLNDFKPSANYQNGQTSGTVPTQVSVTASNNVINVVYKLVQKNVTVNFYKDSVTNTSDSAHYLNSENLFTNPVDVNTDLTTTAMQNAIAEKLNDFKPVTNYQNGQTVGTVPPAVTIDDANNVINVVYYRLQPGFTVHYNYIGGNPDGLPTIVTDSNAQAGLPVNIDSYKLTSEQSGKYAFTGTSDSTLLDGNVLPDGGASITLNYTWPQHSITVIDQYPGQSPVVRQNPAPKVDEDSTITVADYATPDLKGGRFTAVLMQGGSELTASTEKVTGDITITIVYTQVTKKVNVQYVYPDHTKPGTSDDVAYLSTVDPANYLNAQKNPLDDEGGKYKFTGYTASAGASASAPFTLNDDVTLYINYTWNDAVVKVVHVYPDKDSVTDPDVPVLYNDDITVGDVAVPKTESGTYKVTGYKLGEDSIESTDSFKVDQAVETIYIVYENAQAPITVIHKYPSDSGKADIKDDAVMQNVGSTVDLSKITLRTDGGKFVVESIDPSKNFSLTNDGATVTVYYKWATADIKVNFVGKTVDEKGTVLSSESLGSATVTKNVGTAVTSADLATGHSFTGYTYSSADPASFTLTTDGAVVTLTYTKTVTTIPDNTTPQSDTPSTPSTPSTPTATIPDNSTPLASNPNTGDNGSTLPFLAAILGLVSASVVKFIRRKKKA